VRKLDNWLDAFIEYGQNGEAPNHVLFWSGASAIAGALQRKCWVSQGDFWWFPNMYVVLVAPPGIIAKTTTTGTAMRMLRKVEGVIFGPSTTTWQALIECLGNAAVVTTYNGESEETYSLTIHSGELGNLVRPDDNEMMDMLNTMWDCGSIEKATKAEGLRTIASPFLNLLACTTPSWISGNFPAYMLDGGLVSRIIWVYADEKRQLVAYPSGDTPERRELHRYLIDDLNTIGRCEGEFRLDADALLWGTDWYTRHNRVHAKGKDDSRLGGWNARKQSHIHKLAMVLSAARDDSRRITLGDLQRAEREVSALEGTLSAIFDRIGRSEASNNSDRLLDFVARSGAGGVTVNEAARFMRSVAPTDKGFKELLLGLVKSKMVVSCTKGGEQAFRVPQAGKDG
jgi:Protein of unknown function (DUF3987)